MPWFLWSKTSDDDDSQSDYDSSDNDGDDESYDSTAASTPSIATTSIENMKTDNKDDIDFVTNSQNNDTYHMKRKTGNSEGFDREADDKEDDDDSNIHMLNDVEFQGLLLGNAIPSILETTSSRYRAESELSTDLLCDDEIRSPNKYNQKDRNDVNDVRNLENHDIAASNTPVDESNNNMDLDKDDDNQNNQQEEDNNDDDGTTSFEEKQSVLALAAEHDRVDIIQAILGTNSPNSNNSMTPSSKNDVDMERSPTTDKLSDENLEVDETTKLEIVTDSTSDEQRSERERLLNPINTGIPPLHIAISYGSLGAVSCLLRMGADPSLRPDSNRIQEYYQKRQNNNSDNETATPPMTPLKNLSRFDNMSAWELVFGSSSDNNSTISSSADQSSRWSFTSKKKSLKTINLSSTKKDGIRHSFTAEALRCIGSDEVERLHHLLNAGMPSTIEIGNKPLYQWAIDLNATLCQELLCPADQDKDDEENIIDIPTNGNVVVDSQRTSAVLDRTNNNNNEECTYQQLRNKYNELESLSMALSSCLENLAEEVSVCSGLLLVGKGASALATHVRTLKSIKDKKYEDLLRLENVYENTLDELEYWIQEKCSQYISENDIQEQLQTLSTDATTAYLTSVATTSVGGAVSNGTDNHKSDALQQPNESLLTQNDHDDQNELEIQQRYQLTAKIMTCENKIRQLRASIADLSDENVRNLNEVDRRGLSGGILLVRNIRNEIREIEYYYTELQNDETICRAKISMAQHFYFTKKNNNIIIKTTTDDNKQISNEADGVSLVEIPNGDNGGGSTEQHQQQDSFQLLQSSNTAISNLSRLESMELIRSDSSDMIDFHQNEQSHRRLFALWQIILRIIGLRSTTDNNTMTQQPFSDSWIVGSTTSYGKKSSQMTRPVMIV